MSEPLEFEDIAGAHPISPSDFGDVFDYLDEYSENGVPIRSLSSTNLGNTNFKETMRSWVRTHHSRPQDLERDVKRREAFIRQGMAPPTRFPTNSSTQKGNWGEIFLAEYLISSCDSELPVYRLRYNPNVDQSMKGDDVLAFDLDSDPVRILVGEAKFRGSPSKKAVEDIIIALERSYRAGLPASLQFVADRLFQEGQEELGARVEACSDLLVRGKLQLDHIGLLVSKENTGKHVKKNAKSSVRRLAILSLGINEPSKLVASCFKNLEGSV